VNNLLSIKNLKVTVEDKQVLDGVNLTIAPGTMHAIMGPNGSGKSSLSYTIMGHPRYEITDGVIEFEGQPINELSADKRAKAGIFLAMQHPVEIEGVTLKDFLRQAYNALYDGTPKQLRLRPFAEHLISKLHLLKMDLEFAERPINVGFSGGEKKRAEMLQLAVLGPKLVILDEIDSGLDVDALRTVCQTLNTIKQDNPEMSVLLITHYKRILDYVHPDTVHILQKGKIVRSGGPELADEVEKTGYAE
jgi:Fe-S cluster assembly ATP-binding protein